MITTHELAFTYDNGFGGHYECTATVIIDGSGKADVIVSDIATLYGGAPSDRLVACVEEEAIERALDERARRAGLRLILNGGANAKV